MIFFPGIVLSLAQTGVCFWDGQMTRWFQAQYVEVVAGGLEIPLWLAEQNGMTIPPPPVIGHIAGTMAVTEGLGMAVFAGIVDAMAWLAATEPTDIAEFISLGSFAAAEAPDIAVFYAAGDMAATELADAAAFRGRVHNPGE